MSKKILFIANNYMDLHKDIIAEMERQNYEVDFIAEQFHRDDPNNIRGFTKFSQKLVNEQKFNKKIEQIWIDILNSDKYNKTYDFCFVLDGQSLSPILFKTLRERNSNVKRISLSLTKYFHSIFAKLRNTTSTFYRFTGFLVMEKMLQNMTSLDLEQSRTTDSRCLADWKESQKRTGCPIF